MLLVTVALVGCTAVTDTGATDSATNSSPAAATKTTPPPVTPQPDVQPAAQPAQQPAAAQKQAPAVAPATAPAGDVTVYITASGKKYHTGSCKYLSKSKIAISLSAAKAQGYTPCSVCNPPQ
jgi:hypothetical protein